MAMITAERLNALKEKVKAECLRRCYTGSVADYGGSAYDFTSAAASGNRIASEHYEKNAVPLNAISGDIPTSVPRVASEAEIAAMEEKVVSLASIGNQASNSGCAASCTGLCQGGCSGSCSGCSGCGGACSYSCTGSCSGSCTGSCQNSCALGCATCSGGCGDNCQVSCSYCGDACRSDCTGSSM